MSLYANFCRSVMLGLVSSIIEKNCEQSMDETTIPTCFSTSISLHIDTSSIPSFAYFLVRIRSPLPQLALQSDQSLQSVTMHLVKEVCGEGVPEKPIVQAKDPNIQMCPLDRMNNGTQSPKENILAHLQILNTLVRPADYSGLQESSV